MVDERPEDTESAADSSARSRRAPPTIDLKATEVSSEPPRTDSVNTDSAQADSGNVSGEAAAAEAAPQPEPAMETAAAAPDPEPSSAEPPPRPISPWVIAPVSGAVAAALVIGVGWLLGWPAVQPAQPPVPQLSAGAIDELTGRVAGVEAKIGRQASSDQALAARIDGLEKSANALRGELAASRAQSEKLATAIDQVKSMPGDRSASTPDLSAVNDRISRIESAVRKQTAELAQQGNKIAEVGAADAKLADDLPLRRVVAASLLDLAVRHGDAYAAPLDAARQFAENPDVLKPLDTFAASGVPSAGALCRELLEIVPRLAPPPPSAAATTGTGIVDRLQAGAAKLVRIERTDATGTDRGSVVARITQAALRNDLGEAQRELKTLAPADRTAAQAWLEKVEARAAALAASRTFADNAMAGLAKAGQ
ncbi:MULTISPECIES: COG4223 family protein [unclassified Bradyrhizobium]